MTGYAYDDKKSPEENQARALAAISQSLALLPQRIFELDDGIRKVVGGGLNREVAGVAERIMNLSVRVAELKDKVGEAATGIGQAADELKRQNDTDNNT